MFEGIRGVDSWVKKPFKQLQVQPLGSCWEPPKRWDKRSKLQWMNMLNMFGCFRILVWHTLFIIHYSSLFTMKPSMGENSRCLMSIRLLICPSMAGAFELSARNSNLSRLIFVKGLSDKAWCGLDYHNTSVCLLGIHINQKVEPNHVQAIFCWYHQSSKSRRTPYKNMLHPHVQHVLEISQHVVLGCG